jgi:hypothetical protein
MRYDINLSSWLMLIEEFVCEVGGVGGDSALYTMNLKVLPFSLEVYGAAR